MFWKILKCLLAAIAAFVCLWILKSESAMVNFIVAAVVGFMIYYIIPDSKGVGANRLKGITMDAVKKSLIGALVGLSGFFWWRSLNNNATEDSTKRQQMIEDRVLVDGKMQMNLKTVKYAGIFGWICLAAGLITSIATDKNIVQSLRR
jgi:ABC-type transport system involved in cytochrome c biogenesis permease subunit